MVGHAVMSLPSQQLCIRAPSHLVELSATEVIEADLVCVEQCQNWFCRFNYDSGFTEFLGLETSQTPPWVDSTNGDIVGACVNRIYSKEKLDGSNVTRDRWNLVIYLVASCKDYK